MTDQAQGHGWSHIVVTTESAINASALDIGRIDGVGYHAGRIDNVVLYDYARTPAQVAWSYSRGAPVAWYKFDECQGVTAHNAARDGDGESAGNHAAITIGGSGTQDAVGTCDTADTAWGNGAAGRINASLNLDGTDDRVTSGSFSPFAAPGEDIQNVSWGGWFYPKTSAAAKTLIEKEQELRLATNASGEPVCSIYHDPGGGAGFQDAAAGSTTLTLNAWNHLLCTYDGQSIKTYLNDGLIGTTADTGAITAASSVLHIGQNSSSGQRFEGQVDDVRLYAYPLTLSQLRDLMNLGAVRFR